MRIGNHTIGDRFSFTRGQSKEATRGHLQTPVDLRLADASTIWFPLGGFR